MSAYIRTYVSVHTVHSLTQFDAFCEICGHNMNVTTALPILQKLLDITVVDLDPKAAQAFPGPKFPALLPLWTDLKMGGIELKVGDNLTVVHYPSPDKEMAENSFTADRIKGIIYLEFL